jgi:excisionase family DNA binding protein
VLEDELLTIEEVAAYLKLKPQTIYKWAQQKRIPGAKFGKEWRFKRSEILAWVNRRMGEGGADGAPASGGGRIAAADGRHANQEPERRAHRARGVRKRSQSGPETN